MPSSECGTRLRAPSRSVKKRGSGGPLMRMSWLTKSGQELVSFKSSEACLLAFLASALASASGVSDSIALPRLTEPLPVIFALSASKPPGIARFLATCAAATHCPIFLKPPQAVCASWPVKDLIFPPIAVLWLNTSLGDPCGVSAWVSPAVECDAPILPSLPEPRPEGGPPPGCER